LEPQPEPVPGKSPTTSPAAGDATVVKGPGGRVGIGDSLAQAKKAFPPIAGAQTSDTSMSFAIMGQQGWGWASEKQKQAFEVATKAGKVVAIGVTGGDATGEPAKTVALLGEPTRKAEGKAASVYVWEKGENARFWIRIGKEVPVFAVPSMTIIGRKEDLKLLNFQAEDPGAFVKQIDATVTQLNSPEMRRQFEEAKRKALEKRSSGTP